MQMLQAPRHSSRHASSLHEDPHSWTSELLTQDEPEQMRGRHDLQLFPARAVPADPYTAWLAEREADRRAGAVTAPTRPARRFSRNQRTSAPWFTVTVGGPPEGR